MTTTVNTSQPPVSNDSEVSQFRVSAVQVVNWGGYHGHHTMPVDRAGTAILGPTGIGKSTVLDAMLAVMMPNPLVFNRAARDDGGTRSERTVYSYARGKLDDVLDDNRRSVTTHYLRPAGQDIFTAVAITWTDDGGHAVTAVRVVWVPHDNVTNAELNPYTRYLLVQGQFDLARLNAAAQAPAADGRVSRLSTTALKRLVTPGRDLVTDKQERYAQEMRKYLGIGATDEGGRRALTLLRNAQASKGVFSINDLFKNFVLDEPLALTRWEMALQTFREAAELYELFETARKQQQILEPVPDLAERYRAARQIATDHRRLLQPGDEQQYSPVEIRHAERTADWADRRIDEVRWAKEKLVDAETDLKTTTTEQWRRAEDLTARYYAEGGQDLQNLQERLEAAKETLANRTRERATFEQRCRSVNLPIPVTPAELIEVQALANAELDAQPARRKQLDEQVVVAAGEKSELGKRIEKITVDLRSYRSRRTNIPPDADRLRERIATGAGVDTTRLPFVGELLDVPAANQRWRTAVDRVLSGVVRTILVRDEDWASVTQYVNRENMRARVVLTRASTTSGGPSFRPVEGTVAAMVDIAADSPYRRWLAGHLNDRFSYLCVESPDQLESYPQHLKGAVTRAGMMTAGRGSRIKDDRTHLQSWIGFDNSSTVAELEAELEGIQPLVEAVIERLDVLGNAVGDISVAREQLTRLLDEQWRHLDVDSAHKTVAAVHKAIAEQQTAQPDLSALKAERDAAQGEYEQSKSLLEQTGKDIKELNTRWGDWVSVSDKAKMLLEATTPLDADLVDALGRFAWQAAASPAEVEQSLRELRSAVEVSVREHTSALEVAEAKLVGVFGKFLQAYPRPGEADESIESLRTFEAIYAELVNDALPQAKESWLRKTRQDMRGNLRSLLVQIEQDKHTIRTRLEPINKALKAVEFRAGSWLEIDTDKPVPTTDLDEFKATIRRYTQDSLSDTDDAQTEAMFVAMRNELRRLDEQSRSAEMWRRRVFDAREHVEFRAIEHKEGQPLLVHDGVSGKSGGEGQELIAFILGAALRYQLGDGTSRVPRFAPIVLDEGFVKADSEYTGRALHALQTLGFQLIIGAPKDKSTAFEDYVGSVVYINRVHKDSHKVRFYQYDISDIEQ